VIYVVSHVCAVMAFSVIRSREKCVLNAVHMSCGHIMDTQAAVRTKLFIYDNCEDRKKMSLFPR
jgi:hypothetical protein